LACCIFAQFLVSKHVFVPFFETGVLLVRTDPTPEHERRESDARGEMPPVTTTEKLGGPAIAEEVAAERAAEERAAANENLGAEDLGERSEFLADHRAQKPAPERRPITGTQRRVLAFTWIGVFCMVIYGLFMLLSAFNPGYRPIDYIAMFLLLFGLGFILMHGIGYANSVIKASWGYDELRRRSFTPQRAPKVACLVTSFNEPPEVLEETVSAVVNMDYPNKEIVLLDDSTIEETREAVRAIGAKYGAIVVQRTNRKGYKAGAINEYLPKTDATYVAVFDADALPAHNFLRDIVPIIEENPRLAFVQTPQYYANTDVSNVAMGAARQQAVFYEYICEGKSYSHAAFCCGTNVVFRRQALLDVDGFDDTSVTEDFATSLNMHLKGYDSAYYNQVYVYSLAPETLGAYFTQQSRWALGSVGMMRKVMGSLFSGGGRLRLGQWWEYFLSSSYYWIGWVNFCFMLLPLLYIFFGVQPLKQDVFTYLAIFIPYFLFTMNMFYAGMEARGYRLPDMILGQQVGFICFPVHMVAALSGILGFKRPFATTPKGESGRLSWLALWPQILFLVLSAVAGFLGLYKYFMGLDRNTAAIVINAIWAFYHVFLLSGIFVLNKNALRRSEINPYFEEGDTRNAYSRVLTTEEVAGTGPGFFAPVEDARTGRVATPVTRQRVVAPHPRTATGNWALGLMILSLLIIGAIAWTMIAWALAPSTPVNVYVVDRTTGRDYQEHRALTWTLNYLKVKKQDNFGPEGHSTGGDYKFASDFWGFIPGSTENKQVDETHQADYVVGGRNRALPETFEAPGAIYLADTYGEFVEYDYGLEKYVRYVSEPRGLKPDEVDRIQDFYNRDGLVIAEWNTIGYPTLPSQDVSDRAALQRGVQNVQKGLTYYRTQELPTRERRLAAARNRGDANAIATYEQQVRDTQNRIKTAERDLVDLKSLLETAGDNQAQLAAQRKLEKMLKADYRGWYGRYVDKFEDEREYDFRMWKNVRDHLQKMYPDDQSKWEPKGPGFVFYKDGPSRIFNPETRQMEENPFSVPFVVTADELGDGGTSGYAQIIKNANEASDPLLKNVPDSVACRFWFDVTAPMPGAKVLANYKLQLKDSAAQRLREAGFPAEFLQKREGERTEIVMPAAIANRDGNQLRSLYFAGDASDYQLISRITEIFPSTGGIMGFLGKRAGSFSTQFYWSYYEPMLRAALTKQEPIRYEQK
jgi:cellulose synthase (UDP-forming)